MNRESKIQRLKLIVCACGILAVTLMVVFSSLVRSRASGDEKMPVVAPRAAGETDAANGATATPDDATVAQNAPAQDAPPQREGCVECHFNVEPMHAPRSGDQDKLRPDGKDGQSLTCTYCHGGNPTVTVKEEAHVKPKFPKRWQTEEKNGANPSRHVTLTSDESYDYVRFVNPGDLRVMDQTCGACHQDSAHANSKSLMRTGTMLWAAALYNNGGYPEKDSRFGESYSAANGAPERIVQVPEPTAQQIWAKGVLRYMDPLPRWEISQPGNILRVFERGGKRRLEVGLPDREEDNGKPDKGLSPRGLGTANRTDPVYLGLQKTRLLDPTTNHLGTNDHAGDYRSSGCTSCHVTYANDRSPVNSGEYWAKYGNEGKPGRKDTMYDKPEKEGGKPVDTDAPGHPIRHQFTSRMPTAQCMVCHMHPGTNMVTTYTGYMWWDNETDGDKLYPKEQHNPSQDEEQVKLYRNPEGSSLRGLWSSEKNGDEGDKFLTQTGSKEFNDQLTRTQFADYHGHGWIYRAIFKRDRRGNLLDTEGNIVPADKINGSVLGAAVNYQDKDGYDLKSDGPPAGSPVHLKDIHLEKGMHCVDCHYQQDGHGAGYVNLKGEKQSGGYLYNEPRASIEITCADCHGTTTKRATLTTSGPAAVPGSDTFDISQLTGADNQKLFGVRTIAEDRGKGTLFDPTNRKTRKVTKLKDKSGKEVEIKPGEIIQFSTVEPGLWWRVKQTTDTVNPKSGDYNWKSAYAKTVRLNADPNAGEDDRLQWGGAPADESQLAHSDSKISCFTCHSSWMTSCFGCHLSMKANRKLPNRHNEGTDVNSRNYTTYNYQVLRDDVFMLGKDGTSASHRLNGFDQRVSPVRSSSAVLVSSQNQNREWIYSQQQTVSAEGYSGQAFNTHVPHTVRSQETKDCDDCHVSKDGDNNAWLAQTYLQGTNYVNFLGRYIYVAAEDALEVVVATEHDEPQAVKGSSLHRLAYPDFYKKHQDKDKELQQFYEHIGNPEVLQVQIRGEYAYVAAGEGGLRVYDIAQIDHKGFSERITTAPISRFGQKFWVPTKYATAVAAPSTLANDPVRNRLYRDPQSGEFQWITPDKAAAAYNEWRGKMSAWEKLSAADRAKSPAPVNPMVNEEQPIHPLYAYLYIADREEGLVTVGAGTLLDGDPLNNYLKRALTWNPDGILNGANNITIAGTFAFITTDKHKLVIVDLDNPSEPKVADVVDLLCTPRSVAVQFRYAFVADEAGLEVLDVTNVFARKGKAKLLPQALTKLEDAHDVYVARTYAFVANGKEGMAVVDIEKPEAPQLAFKYNAGGELSDTHQIKVGMTNASLFAYVADGHNGLRIIQMMTPENSMEYGGFSPRLDPAKFELIAKFKTKGPALAISKGLDRDRAVDESGNQTAVFGRRGARPLSLEESMRLYMVPGSDKLFTVQGIRQLKDPSELKSKATTARNNRKGAPQVSPSPLQMLNDVTIGAFNGASKATRTGIVAGLSLGLIGITALFIRRRRGNNKP